MREVYLDHAATTKMKKEVLESMLPYFEESYGNPSTSYKLGLENKRAIEEARKKVANAIGAEYEEEIYFTSGGSEADNLAIKGIAKARKNRGKHIITSEIEHSAIINSCKQLENEGYEITYVSVDTSGIIKLNELENAIREDTILISVMFANNEIGTIQPIFEIAKIAKSKNILLHVDAVQAVGSIKIDVKKMNIDMLSISAHKFYGPKGIGALYIRNGIDVEPLISGGHQEKNIRAGTENVPAIVGMGKAIELANKNINEYSKKLAYLRDYFIFEIQKNISFVRLNGHIYKRLPGNVNLSIEGVNNQTLILLLAERGIYCSGGSACNTFANNPSHVLKAIALPNEVINSSIRITFGEENTLDDVKYVVKNLTQIVERIRKNL